jgi:outer membrane protein OmpA-like peptidoglycan-associated protein
VIDSQDACADVPGVASEDPARNGCPPDRDGDGILDDVDACPDAAGEAHEEKEKSGCPRVAIVVDEIRITEKVHFATRSARILPESDGLLEEIARLLRDHPEILLVSIEGHTDSRDNDYYNKQLSTWRAAAVRRWLVERGKVEPKRLTSEGFGEDRPIASNDTEEGMARNRRVEFLIKQRAPKPDAAEGPAP